MTEPTSSYRTSQENRKALADLYGSVSAGTEASVEACLNIRLKVIKEIERKFSTVEISTLASILRHSRWDPATATDTQVLSSKIKALAPEGVSSGIDAKIGKLTPAECYFLQEEIYRRIK